MDDTSSSPGDFSDQFMKSKNNLQSFDGETSKRAAPRKQNRIRKMWLAAFASLLIAMSLGLVSGFSAPATYDMQNRPTSVINPTDKEVMWIGSILAVGLIIGSLIAGPMADKFGRKDILIFNILPYGFGWLIVCYADNIPVLLCGRFLGGLASGIICVAVPMYCVEIATADERGILGSAFQGFLVIGNLLSVTIGAFVPWKYLAVNGAAVSIITTIIFIPMPETPRWLLMKGRLKDAIKVMDYLQDGYVNAEKECSLIYEDLQNQPKGNVTWAELIHPTSLKPGIITLFIMFFQQFSGINAVFLYSSKVFKVSKDWLDPKIATIILAAVQVVLTLISNIIIDKVGRKILLILSGGLMGISYAIFGIYYYMLSADKTIEHTYAWIPLVCCTVAVVGYSIGYGPIPFLLSAEMLPVRVRSTTSSIVHVFDGIFIFIITNTFSDFEDLLHNYGAFWFYSSMSTIGLIYVMIFVPETKGKKLEEIEELFYKKKERHDINIHTIS